MPHERVFVVGDKPAWLSDKVIHIPFEDKLKNKTLNAWAKLLHACKQDEISDDFILFNDDFVVLKPQKEVPYYYQGNIPKHKDSRRSYMQTKIRTGRLFDSPKNFEIHCPIVYNKKKFLELPNLYKIRNIYLHRSLYCNHYHINGTPSVDIKARNAKRFRDIIKSNPDYISFADSVESDIAFRVLLEKRFPSISGYEQEGLPRIESNLRKLIEKDDSVHKPIRRRRQHLLPVAMASRKSRKRNPRASLFVPNKKGEAREDGVRENTGVPKEKQPKKLSVRRDRVTTGDTLRKGAGHRIVVKSVSRRYKD